MRKDRERTRKETDAVVQSGGDGSLDRDTNSREGEVETKGEPFRMSNRQNFTWAQTDV